MAKTPKSTQWLHCPHCGAKTHTKICEDTVLLKFPLFCPKCKQETLVDYLQSKLLKSNVPDE